MVTCCIKSCLSVILWVKVVLARTVIVTKLPTASLPRTASGSIEDIARIYFLWLIPGVKIMRISWYLRCMFLPQTSGSAFVLSSLTNSFIIFQLQFHQEHCSSGKSSGEPCKLSSNKDVEVRFHL